jgi:serine O-acetyltransferase
MRRLRKRVDSSAALELPLLEILREDLERHNGQWHRPGFHAVALHRIATWQRGLPLPIRYPVLLAYGALYFVTRNLYGIELPRTTKVGRRLLIGHQSGIVVNQVATIGDDCVIRQNVTIGTAQWGESSGPTIGNGVEIGAGAVILGEITIGDGALIGSNAVVMTDVPAGARVVAPAPRILPRAFVSAAGGSSTEGAPVDGNIPATEPTLDAVLQIINEVAGFELPGPDTPFLSSGLVDSLVIARLLDALEEAFALRLPVEELDAATFDTARDVLDVVMRRRTS